MQFSITHANRSRSQQSTEVIAYGIRGCFGFFYIANGNHADQMTIIIHDGQFFNTVLTKQFLAGIQFHAMAHRNQPFYRRHHCSYFFIRIAFETDIAVGHNATDPAIVIEYREAGKAVFGSQSGDFIQRGFRRNGERFLYHAGFIAFDAADFGGLLFR